MGLFGKLMKGLKYASEQQRSNPSKDERPPLTTDYTDHWANDCIRVWLNENGMSFAADKGEERIQVRVRKSRKKEDGAEYSVSLTDGTVIGTLGKNDFMRSGAKTRGETAAEVYGPIWQGENYGRLYLIVSDEAKDRRSLTTHFTVNNDRYSANGPVDEVGGEILESSKGKGKPTYVIVAGGSRVCEVTARMGAYKTIAERADKPLRRVISEKRDGDYGPYWRISLYF